MNDVILYLDCDGVILDTMDTAYRMMSEEGLDISNGEVVNHFFINTDWNILIYEAGIIKDAIIKIKKIIASNIFSRVSILTKTSGNLEEEKIKRILFGKLLPDVPVITVNFRDNKDEVVDPVGNILVEDSIQNAARWNNAGGIGIIFVKDNPNHDKDIIDDLGDICEAYSVKKLLKTRKI